MLPMLPGLGLPPGMPPGLPNPFTAATTTSLPAAKPVDPKIAAFGHKVSAVLARERIGPKFDVLPSVRVKHFDFSIDGSSEMGTMLESMGVQAETIKLAEVPVFLLNFRLMPEEHIVIVSGLIVPQPKEVFQAFQEFVNGGGKMIVLNSLPFLVGQAFPGYFAPAPPSTLLGARLKVCAADKADKELVQGHSDGEYVVIDNARFHVHVNTKSTARVLTKLSSPKNEPILIRFTQSAGTVYMFTIKGTQHKKEKGYDYSADLKAKNASIATIAAFECLRKVHFEEAFELAFATYGFYETVARILIREHPSGNAPAGVLPGPVPMAPGPMGMPPMPPPGAVPFPPPMPGFPPGPPPQF